jgi:hypothetical protein
VIWAYRKQVSFHLLNAVFGSIQPSFWSERLYIFPEDVGIAMNYPWVYSHDGSARYVVSINTSTLWWCDALVDET